MLVITMLTVIMLKTKVYFFLLLPPDDIPISFSLSSAISLQYIILLFLHYQVAKQLLCERNYLHLMNTKDLSH